MRKTEMQKLSVGDQVRVKQNPKGDNDYDVTASMMKKIGQIGEVYETREDGVRLSFSNGKMASVTWTQSMIEHIDKTTSPTANITSYTCTKTFPGCVYNVGDTVDPSNHPAEYFIPEFFSANVAPAVPKVKKPRVEIEGYAAEVDTDGTMVNWGCRRFSYDDFVAVVKAARILNNHDLSFTTGRSIRNPIPASRLEKLQEYVESLRPEPKKKKLNKWCVQVTPSNVNTLERFRNWDNKCLGTGKSVYGFLRSDKIWSNNVNTGYTLISFEEFLEITGTPQS